MGIEQTCEGILIVSIKPKLFGTVATHKYVAEKNNPDNLCPEHRKMYDDYLKNGYERGFMLGREWKDSIVLIRKIPEPLPKPAQGCVVNFPFLGQQILAYRQLGYCRLYKEPPAKPEDTCPYAKPDKAGTTQWVCSLNAKKPK